MIELTKTKRITIGVMIMLGVLLLGLLTMANPKYAFKSDPAEMIDVIGKGEYKVSPGQLAEEILNKNKESVLIDIRSQYEFNKGSIEGAINIQASDILDDDKFQQFSNFENEGKNVYIYGKDVAEANVLFMTLYALGIQNIRILQGGYDYFKNKDLNEIANDNVQFSDETPMIDIQKYIKEENVKSQTKSKLENQTVNKSTSVKKSAKPAAKIIVAPKKEEVEEEGC